MITHLILASLMCLGVYVITAPGMIFGKLGDYIERTGPFSKPLGECLTCMASVYGTIYHFTIVGIPTTILAFKLFVLFLLCLAGLNFILNTLVVKHAEEDIYP